MIIKDYKWFKGISIMDDNELINKQITSLITPWYNAIKTPEISQKNVLDGLLQIYQQTDYGRSNHADAVHDVISYRNNFPVTSYEVLRPTINKVMSGETGLLLNEPAIGWAITRGTTKGENKFIPMTPTDLKMRVSAGGQY